MSVLNQDGVTVPDEENMVNEEKNDGIMQDVIILGEDDKNSFSVLSLVEWDAKRKFLEDSVRKFDSLGFRRKSANVLVKLARLLFYVSQNTQGALDCLIKASDCLRIPLVVEKKIIVGDNIDFFETLAVSEGLNTS
ncbi:MAG: hypothetical protein UT09_C0037G0002 [Parcubacteria group bacterium GW2011_GWF2_38_8]|nr:MAG: hypothetical protein UT09_C0037G0002 [Parcubacteria group bacterium GW2011_GWF2_38_8]